VTSSGTSLERKWLGTMPAVRSNQNSEIRFRTLPLSVTGVGITTS